MENAIENLQEGGGVNSVINKEEAELTEEKMHNNLKGTKKISYDGCFLSSSKRII